MPCRFEQDANGRLERDRARHVEPRGTSMKTVRVGRLQTDDVDRLRRLHYITLHYITFNYITFSAGLHVRNYNSITILKPSTFKMMLVSMENPLKFCHILLKYALK